MRTTSRWSGGWIGAFLALAATVPAADEPRLADYFGFLPLEIYKLDPRIGGLIIRDFDGDGTGDIAVVNNGRSRIDLLLSGARSAGDDAAAREPNQVPSSSRLRLVSLPVNKEVVSLQAGDFDGDSRPDLAYYGTPSELIVLRNAGGGRFEEMRRLSTGEAVESGTALTVGDLDRDGRDDLALLTPNEILIVLQQEGGRLGIPDRLTHTSGSPQILNAVDLDGDGGDDLVLLDGGSDDPIRVRFSTEGGRLGPEQRFAVEPPRAIAFSPLDDRPGAELLMIESQSGRARAYTLDEGEEGEPERLGRLTFYPLPRGDSRGRAVDSGDVDGDGRVDVVVTDPASAQLIVYRQGKSGPGPAQTFPSLVGARGLRLADLDGDEKNEVLVLSESEKQLGQARMQDGRLSFPAPLPITGDPVALEAADLDGDGAPEVLYMTRDKNDKGADRFTLRALKREPSGTFVPFRWGQEDAVEAPGVNDVPAALRVDDVNRDGLPDVLIFAAYGSPVLLLGRPGAAPAASGGSLGPLANASAASVGPPARGDAALIVAQGTYARDVTLSASGQWVVQDQYNAGRGSAQIVGAAALDADGDGKAEVVLMDRASKSLLVLAEKEGVYRPAGSLSVGPIDFQGLRVADLDGDARDDLLVAGADKFGVVLTGRKGQRLRALAGYESPRKETQFADLIGADLNGDGQADVAITDRAEHFVEIATFAGPGDWQRALSFKVFEQKSFRDRDSLVEPRDLAVGDVDGDGRSDLVLVAHDRVLVYRQDPGPRTDAPARPAQAAGAPAAEGPQNPSR